MRLIYFIFFSILSFASYAQGDSAKAKLATSSLFTDSSAPVRLKDTTAKAVKKDTVNTASKLTHDPRKATFRSAVLPGWGQAYNKQYWKIPIVYGALAIPATTYIFNSNYYRWTKFAYQAVYAASNQVPDSLRDSSMLKLINKKVLSSEGQVLSLSTYQSARNNYKRNKDYSLLWFLILWGVNVADATVFGHLKEFDVSDDLTLRVNPSYSPSTKSTGVSLVLNFKNPPHKAIPSF